MRKTEPDLPRPYRCWGYPWVPGLFVAGALALTFNIWLQRPGRSSIGLLLILAGLPFYRRWNRSVSVHSDAGRAGTARKTLYETSSRKARHGGTEHTSKPH